MWNPNILTLNLAATLEFLSSAVRKQERQWGKEMGKDALQKAANYKTEQLIDKIRISDENAEYLDRGAWEFPRGQQTRKINQFKLALNKMNLVLRFATAHFFFNLQLNELTNKHFCWYELQVNP